MEIQQSKRRRFLPGSAAFRLAIVALVLATPSVPQDDRFAWDVKRFVEKFGRFVESYYGCPEDWKTAADCDPANGKLDYDLWLSAHRSGAKLFCEVD